MNSTECKTTDWQICSNFFQNQNKLFFSRSSFKRFHLDFYGNLTRLQKQGHSYSPKEFSSEKNTFWKDCMFYVLVFFSHRNVKNIVIFCIAKLLFPAICLSHCNKNWTNKHPFFCNLQHRKSEPKNKPLRHHLCSTYAKFSEKLTFLAP